MNETESEMHCKRGNLYFAVNLGRVAGTSRFDLLVVY